VTTDGPDHDREFTVALQLNDQEIAVGVGRSKIDAEQAAARVALDRWLAEVPSEEGGVD